MKTKLIICLICKDMESAMKLQQSLRSYIEDEDYTLNKLDIALENAKAQLNDTSLIPVKERPTR